MARDNKTIGRFNLDGIRPAPRGVPQIEVSFDIDANGILNVSARDKDTGKEQKIRIEASSGLSDAEIARMRDEAKANEAADKQARERVDKLNKADSVIFQSEKELKEHGAKLSANTKANIETAVANLKEAHQKENIEALDGLIDQVNNAWQAAAPEMQNTNNSSTSQQQTSQEPSQGQKGDSEVTDVDFEEVK